MIIKKEVNETINLSWLGTLIPMNVEKIYSRKFIRKIEKILKVANKRIKDPKEVFLLLTVARIILERQNGFWFNSEEEDKLRMIIEGEH